MGHGSKKMIYEVYGNYVEGLETDAGKILHYFGKDFMWLKQEATSTFATNHGESIGERTRWKRVTYYYNLALLVEAAGVEPASENIPLRHLHT